MLYFSNGEPGTVPPWVPIAAKLVRHAAPGKDFALALLRQRLVQGPTSAGVDGPGRGPEGAGWP
eukprot:349859-Chlamydomonas_euryale.AAC.3